MGFKDSDFTEPTGRKDDQDKLPMHLIDVDALEGMVRVLQFGMNKYSANNWKGGISYTRLIGAALRHTFAILRGQDLDPESGEPHVDHLQCCAHFLSFMMKNRKDLDDRYHG